MPQFDYQGAINAGYSNQEIEEFLRRQASSNVPQRTASGFAGNVLKSGGRAVGDIASSLVNVVNPNMEKNTIANLGKLGVDAVKLATGDKEKDNRARLVADFYKQRYGGIENIKKTAYEDPVGLALDASVLLGGAGALTKGVGAVSKSSRLAKVGQILSDVSEVVDPLSQTSKLIGKGKSVVSPKLVGASKSSRESVAKILAGKSSKATATQRERFMDITGQDIDNFMIKNKVYTRNDVKRAIKPLQEQYNKMVRTDKKISGQVYADALIKQAEDLIRNDRSATARQVANKLLDEAEIQRGLGDITDTVLTNTKTGEYSKVSGKAMVDPVTESFNQRAGNAGIEALEKIAPGSKKIGKKLQAYREFEKIVKKQQELGKGAQMLNLFKPVATGVISGTTAGLLTPGLGNLAGAVIGGTGAVLANSPTVQRGVSKALASGVSLPPIGKLLSKSYPVGKVASRVNPDQKTEYLPMPQQSSQISNQVESPYAYSISQGLPDVNKLVEPTAQTANEPILSPEGQWRWDETQQDWVPNDTQNEGVTDEKLRQALDEAIMSGDKKRIDLIKNYMTTREMMGGGEDVLQLSDTAIKNITDLKGALADTSNLYTKISESNNLVGPIAGYRRFNPYDVDALTLQAEVDRVRQVVGKALEGGVLRKEDEEKYKKILPTLNDPKEVTINKLASLYKKLNDDVELYTQMQKSYGKGRGAENMLPSLEVGF